MTKARRGRRAILYRRRLALKGRIVVAEKFASTNVSTILGNNGYVLYTNLNEMPQYATYSQLYRRFRLLSVTYILVPQYNSAEFPPNTIGNSLSRLTYAIQDTPAPNLSITSEAQVLEDNGCKIVTSPGKIIYIKHYPRPELATDGVGLTTPVVSFGRKTPQYFNTENPENASTSWGSQVDFSGVNVWCAAANTSVQYAVFVKQVVEFSDPA